MNQLGNIYRVNKPEILQTTRIAFDAAWDVLRKNCKTRESTRQQLARVIFRLADEGETDALRLCKLALDKIAQSNVQVAKKQTHSNPAIWNSLRSLPGRNWHVQRQHDLFLWIDNRGQVGAGRSV